MKIGIEGFMGMQPRVSNRLLPPTAATLARNTQLHQGELRGFNEIREAADLTGEYFTVRRAMKIVDPSGSLYGDDWIAFDSRNVDIVRSPLINDAHDRYYWAGDGRPKYNSSYRILQGLPEWYLGVPTPTAAPGVTPPAGTAETRAYVYTFVSSMGEEGAPSPPTLATGAASGTWSLTGISSTVPDSSNRSITLKNIYRTVPGVTTTQYFFVAQIPIAQTTYSDTFSNAVVAANNALESTGFAEPPTDLEGFVVMPNGYLAGWVGKRLLFSEPYRPHAWPAEYELATDYPIVGLTVWNSTLVVGTKSRPYLGQGIHPASFTLQLIDSVEPCLSRRGMVATVAGAYYPSVNGIALVNSSGVSIITRDILTKEEWSAYSPSTIFAAQLGLRYIAFNTPDFGFVFDPTEPTTKFVELDGFDSVEGIETDPYTGDVLIISADKVWRWDPDESPTVYWQWKSKVFHLPKPVNFGAVMVSFDATGTDTSNDATTYYYPYNQARIATPLGQLGGHALGGPAQNIGTVPGWVEPETIQPLGGGSLYSVELLSSQAASVRLIVHCGDRGIVFDTTLGEERLLRLPSGFKSDLWQFELVGNTSVFSLKVAETAKELKDI